MAGWPYNTSRWSKLREAKLAEKPLCEICQRRGIVEPAVAVDHFVAIRHGGDPFPPLSGLLSLCVACHNEKTASFDKPGADPFRRRFKGFDANGNPIDPFDAWHAERPGGGRKTGDAQPRTGREVRRLLNKEEEK